MVERRDGKEGIYPDEPFILDSFEQRKGKAVAMSNRFHVIKNLGVMLLELEKNKVMEEEMDLLGGRIRLATARRFCFQYRRQRHRACG